MKSSPLIDIFKNLSQGSKNSVQNGESLSVLDRYLHVKRSVEDILYQKMQDIENAGGGIVLLVGSAGDGKSHLISCLKDKRLFSDFIFYNDATVSYSPNVTAIETLKQALSAYTDYCIGNTTRKMLLAINLGKLNEFIEDTDVQNNYGQLIHVVKPIFDDDSISSVKDSNKIKVVQFTNQQIYEMQKDDNSEYPVDSSFIRQILVKITAKSSENPFFKAYIDSKPLDGKQIDPVVLNYELLCIPALQNSIVHMTIEAIIRFQLMMTPRDFLDFISRIIVCKNYAEFTPANDFFNSLLPTLMFSGGDNRILRTIYNLDPLKYSNKGHDDDLAVLFTSIRYPHEYIGQEFRKIVPQEIINYINQFYDNNGKYVKQISALLFRLKHLLSYHSESTSYKKFLKLYRGFINKDSKCYSYIYRLTGRSIVRHYGSYLHKQKEELVPLNIQGSDYKLFAKVHIKPDEPTVQYTNQNEFFPYITLKWKVGDDRINLRMDYELLDYLLDLDNGMLNVNYENDKSLEFNRFIRQLISHSNQGEEVVIIGDDNKEQEHTLSRQFDDTLTLN